MFPQTSANHTPITPFIILSTAESTNNYAMAKLHAGMELHDTCFFAVEQTQGRGQRGKQWLSTPGENITMSTVFAPAHSVSANITAFPFLLSASMALGCYDFIKDYGVSNLSIKWPNDLFAGDRKAAGILIDNIYKGVSWEWTVVGTGININQVSFPDGANRAVSIKLLTGHHYNTLKSGKRLYGFLQNRFNGLKNASAEAVMNEYNSLLYKRGEQVKLKKENIVFATSISHVSASGELVTNGAVQQSFSAGEVEFI